MNCPTCQAETKVISTREFPDGIMRRRKCKNLHRFSTMETFQQQSRRRLCLATKLHCFETLTLASQAARNRGGQWKFTNCEHCGAWHLTPVVKTDTNFQQT
jgi:hypothetical protein